jgi:hypothetical protein
MTCKGCKHSKRVCLKQTFEKLEKTGLPILIFVDDSNTCENENKGSTREVRL